MNYFWLLTAKTGSYGRMVGSRLCPCGVVLKLEVEEWSSHWVLVFVLILD